MIGTLMLTDTGRWAIVAKGRNAYEITSGELFAVEVAGVMRTTRMEFANDPVHEQGGRYVSVDGFRLFEGMRAGVGSDMTTPREPNRDEQAGIDWWNGLTEQQRRQVLVGLEADGHPVTVAHAWQLEKAHRQRKEPRP